MKRSLSRLFGRRPAAPRGHRARLGVQRLEGRDVPAVFTVNSLADNNNRDNFLTLDEAIRVNVGALAVGTLTAAEKAQVSGAVNTNDRIQFAVAGTINMVGPYQKLTKSLEILGPDETGTALGLGG